MEIITIVILPCRAECGKMLQFYEPPPPICCLVWGWRPVWLNISWYISLPALLYIRFLYYLITIFLPSYMLFSFYFSFYCQLLLIIFSMTCYTTEAGSGTTVMFVVVVKWERVSFIVKMFTFLIALVCFMHNIRILWIVKLLMSACLVDRLCDQTQHLMFFNQIEIIIFE